MKLTPTSDCPWREHSQQGPDGIQGREGDQKSVFPTEQAISGKPSHCSVWRSNWTIVMFSKNYTKPSAYHPTKRCMHLHPKTQNVPVAPLTIVSNCRPLPISEPERPSSDTSSINWRQCQQLHKWTAQGQMELEEANPTAAGWTHPGCYTMVKAALERDRRAAPLRGQCSLPPSEC